MTDEATLSTPPAPDAVKRYVNDGDLLPDGRTYVLASDYDALARQVAGLREALGELLSVSETWYRAYCKEHGLTFLPHERGQTPVIVKARDLCRTGDPK